MLGDLWTDITERALLECMAVLDDTVGMSDADIVFFNLMYDINCTYVHV